MVRKKSAWPSALIQNSVGCTILRPPYPILFTLGFIVCQYVFIVIRVPRVHIIAVCVVRSQVTWVLGEVGQALKIACPRAAASRPAAAGARRRMARLKHATKAFFNKLLVTK
jgi:hypothetical protein